MSAEMITAIGALVLGFGSVVSAILLNRKTMALLEYRMSKVEKKLDEHNGYARLFNETADKISKIETDVAVVKTSVKYLEKEIQP